jgi:hypothetical protein
MATDTWTAVGVALVPVRRIGPSRFAAWRACRLREACRAVVSDRVLPRPPAAHLGSVIHRLIETASASPGLTIGAAEVLFGDLVTNEEGAMRGSAVERNGIPLSRSVRDFEVRRHRAIQAAVAASAGAIGHGGGGGPQRTGTEVWIETGDGQVGGFVDEIVPQGGRLMIRDFKTGLAAKPGTPEQAEAFMQLKLYAAVYADAFGTWPDVLEIVPLQGEVTVIPVDRDECVELLREARRLLAETNAIIETCPDARNVLATPASGTCRYCEYRPLCERYLTVDKASGEWPRDVVGILSKVVQLKNGTLMVEVTDTTGTLIRVRGITADLSRHPELPGLIAGTKIGIFNIEGNRDVPNFSEGTATTIVTYAQ